MSQPGSANVESDNSSQRVGSRVAGRGSQAEKTPLENVGAPFDLLFIFLS